MKKLHIQATVTNQNGDVVFSKFGNYSLTMMSLYVSTFLNSCSNPQDQKVSIEFYEPK